MPAHPGGYATSPAVRARRDAILRELWPLGVPLVDLGRRLGVSPAYVSKLAREADLAPRHFRLTRKDGSVPSTS